ncbi:MAG: primosomal protein N' [Tissierellia bacterium]|nr:primosomal protein N' [Tissierellia bacterium]
MNYKIIINHKNRINHHLFTYHSPKKIAVGSRVIIPFGRGNQTKMGLIVGKDMRKDYPFEIKEILDIIDEEPIINEELIELAFYMEDYYLSDLSSAFQTVLPPGNWQNIEELFYTEKKSDDELLQYLEKKRTWKEIQKTFPSLSRKDLLKRVEDKEIIHEYGLSRHMDYQYEKYISSTGRIQIGELPKNAKSQIQILKYLKKDQWISQKELMKKLQVSYSSIQSLYDKGAIKIENRRISRKIIGEKEVYKKHRLNAIQQDCYDKIMKNDGKYLLHGVTGSGKTEVYLQLVEKTLKMGKTAIILVPEISLTPQTIHRFAGRFDGKVAVIHSKLTLNERFEQYRLIKEKKVRIVIGARSAIFSPLENIGIIIIDEAHELSYRSEQNPKYNALEIAERRMDYHGGKLVLGSATPGVREYYRGKKKEFTILEMKQRATSRGLPHTKIIDMREEMHHGNYGMISEPLAQEIQKRLEKKEQSILFLNKRGHSSFVLCRRCGYVIECDSCDISMTYHKSKGRLLCHLCGRTKKLPRICPNCGSEHLKEFGGGTEKLEEEIQKIFPSANVYRMDSDTTHHRRHYDNVDEKMRKGEIDILIGTQMLSKGLDFEKVSLVGVVAADISLNMGNYQAYERTFQLITQVSGRAGRGTSQGEVLIQSYQPTSIPIIAAARNDYDFFYTNEIKNRKLYDYPPFCTILKINIAHKNRFTARHTAMEISKHIQNELKNNKISVLMTGPNPSPIERVNNYYRFDLHYKIHSHLEEIKKTMKRVLLLNTHHLRFEGIRINIMIDPISFL